MEHVIIKTEDGVDIHGVYRDAGGTCAVLLLHMMPATKESWGVFAEALRARGISSLAIDERGHGESVLKNGGYINYREFTDEEQQAKRLDVETAVAWLMKTTKLDRAHIAVVGASIGANLAIRYGFEHPKCPAIVALSPGVNYHGVLTEDAVSGFAKGQPIFIAVSDEDTTSALSVKKLERIPTEGKRTVVRLHGKGHGTTMFERDESFMREVLQWLLSRF